jgi:NADH:ubiquinone reductase (H+-translocating)
LNADKRSIVIAGAGYAGLHITQRLGAWLKRRNDVTLTLVDKNDYHQVLTELPRVASGRREENEVEIPLESVLSTDVRFEQTTVDGIDLVNASLLTGSGAIRYKWLVLALGSRPNDFNIPGLSDRVLYMWSSQDATKVWDAVTGCVKQAAATTDAGEQRRLMTVVIGGGGATGVELAGAFAEELPQLAKQYGAPAELAQVQLIEAGHTILAGSSQELIAKANEILRQLGVRVCTNSMIVEASPQGFKLKDGELVQGGTYVWAGGVKANAMIRGTGLEVGYNERVKVDMYLRALDHPDIFVAGDLASVVDKETGLALPPLAQIALDEGDTVAANLKATVDGRPLEPFEFKSKGFVVGVGARRGVAEVAGLTLGGRLAHALKEAIEWEYRQSVKHLRGWGAA